MRISILRSHSSRWFCFTSPRHCSMRWFDGMASSRAWRRCRPANEQAVPQRSAEDPIGADLGHPPLADQLAFLGEAVNAVLRRAPEVAVHIDPHAIGNARCHFDQDFTAPELAVAGDLEFPDV